METSAKTAMNVNEIFMAIGNSLCGEDVWGGSEHQQPPGNHRSSWISQVLEALTGGRDQLAKVSSMVTQAVPSAWSLCPVSPICPLFVW